MKIQPRTYKPFGVGSTFSLNPSFDTDVYLVVVEDFGTDWVCNLLYKNKLLHYPATLSLNKEKIKEGFDMGNWVIYIIPEPKKPLFKRIVKFIFGWL